METDAEPAPKEAAVEPAVETPVAVTKVTEEPVTVAKVAEEPVTVAKVAEGDKMDTSEEVKGKGS